MTADRLRFAKHALVKLHPQRDELPRTWRIERRTAIICARVRLYLDGIRLSSGSCCPQSPKGLPLQSLHRFPNDAEFDHWRETAELDYA